MLPSLSFAVMVVKSMIINETLNVQLERMKDFERSISENYATLLKTRERKKKKSTFIVVKRFISLEIYFILQMTLKLLKKITRFIFRVSRFDVSPYSHDIT